MICQLINFSNIPSVEKWYALFVHIENRMNEDEIDIS